MKGGLKRVFILKIIAPLYPEGQSAASANINVDEGISETFFWTNQILKV